jgi:hypothetical protein
MQTRVSISINRALLLSVLSLWHMSAFAAPVLWTLNNVTSPSGGTASGSFIYDASIDRYLSVNIETIATGYGGTYTQPAQSYTDNDQLFALLPGTTFPYTNTTAGVYLTFSSDLSNQLGAVVTLGGASAEGICDGSDDCDLWDNSTNLSGTVSSSSGACGAPIDVPANTWTLVGISCVPDGAESTITDFFADLGTTNYAVDWIVWRREYDNLTLCSAANFNDCYVKSLASDTVENGDALWVYSVNQASLSYPVSASVQGRRTVRTPALFSSDTNPRDYLLANPFAGTINVSEARLFVNNGNGGRARLSISNAVAAGYIDRPIHYWNGNTYFTRDITGAVGDQPQLRSKEAVWITAPPARVPPSGPIAPEIVIRSPLL